MRGWSEALHRDDLIQSGVWGEGLDATERRSRRSLRARLERAALDRWEQRPRPDGRGRGACPSFTPRAIDLSSCASIGSLCRSRRTSSKRTMTLRPFFCNRDGFEAHAAVGPPGRGAAPPTQTIAPARHRASIRLRTLNWTSDLPAIGDGSWMMESSARKTPPVARKKCATVWSLGALRAAAGPAAPSRTAAIRGKRRGRSRTEPVLELAVATEERPSPPRLVGHGYGILVEAHQRPPSHQRPP